MQGNYYLGLFLYTLLCAGCPQTPEPPIPEPSTEDAGREAEKEAASREAPQAADVSSSPPSQATEAAPVPEKPSSSTSQNSAATGSPSSDGSASRPSSTSASEAAAAINRAQELFDRAQSQHAAGNHAAAFLSARDAWVLVNELEDPRAARLATEIHGELGTYADRAGRENRGAASDSSRPLILK